MITLYDEKEKLISTSLLFLDILLIALALKASVAIAGVVTNLRRRKTRKTGEWWASMRFEDMEGQVEVLVFPKAYVNAQTALDDERLPWTTTRESLLTPTCETFAAHASASRKPPGRLPSACQSLTSTQTAFGTCDLS